MLSRTPDDDARRIAIVGPPDALARSVASLHQLYAMLPLSTIAEMRSWKTVAVGQAVDEDDPTFAPLVWTANGNWNDPLVSAAMASMGITRMDPGQSRASRGPTGAPGGAEQRMMSDENWVIRGMAVSRPPCADCSAALAAYPIENGPLHWAVVPPPSDREVQARDTAISTLSGAAATLANQVQLYAGEHKMQADLIGEPSLSGVGGYLVSLFNAPIPEQTIWQPAIESLAQMREALSRGLVRAAMSNLIRARRRFLFAQQRYLTWKNGIEGAGQQAQIAIGVVAVAAIAAVVAPVAAIEILGAGAEAESAAATEAMTARIVTTLPRLMPRWRPQRSP